jgi:hypothetical protein
MAKAAGGKGPREIASKVDLFVPDPGSRDRDVVLVKRGACWGNPRGVGKLSWGGTGEDLGRGRSVYGQPGTKVDRVASHQKRDSK